MVDWLIRRCLLLELILMGWLGVSEAIYHLLPEGGRYVYKESFSTGSLMVTIVVVAVGWVVLTSVSVILSVWRLLFVEWDEGGKEAVILLLLGIGVMVLLCRRVVYL